ncbi:RecQ family ATP-dependent DNA helicase [Fundidesulfovibrio putealis]|uniref:RecQ family ATP-dependent DNA helicase n=1 Tax=Fundidesulfovibrio putealis TaxID=270496 RepID=UPI0006878DD3|nr:RecQ family ATP-dependent DNA helicase [Fundidesulfovibrio putealis]
MHSTRCDNFLHGAVAIDLEIHPGTRRILKVGAVSPGRDEVLAIQGRFSEEEAVRRLDRFCRGARHLVGHHVALHDLSHLRDLWPTLELLRIPVVDTLWLSPMAFPRNPYHRLAKPYKIIARSAGDPVRDAQQALILLREEWAAFQDMEETVVGLYSRLLSMARPQDGYAAFFGGLLDGEVPDARHIAELSRTVIAGCACPTAVADACDKALTGQLDPLCLAYALAWVRVAGDNSVAPAWVRHTFPNIPGLLDVLRDRPCADPACSFCREHHDVLGGLKRFFGYDRFLPVADETPPIQEQIVRAMFSGANCLAVMPTGAGKSLCYQLPGLMRARTRSRLTVVISPLQSLMKDQVDGLLARGVINAATINGLLTVPERSDALDAIRMGIADLVFIAPEQLRNRTVKQTLDQRELGLVVYDEAHCLSKWGHDFRPDYLYVARALSERARRLREPLPQIACFTATAKPDVVEDIRAHFLETLGLELNLFLGGHERTNLSFEVIRVSPADKSGILIGLLEGGLREPGGAVVFMSARRRCEEMAARLRGHGLDADYFHAGRTPEEKRRVQESFLQGHIRVIVATNAFGMGVDKPDIRLVIHSDPPGSLENYLQEAGRAGRDREPARCVLLYDPEDMETQFRLTAQGRLELSDMRAIHAGLKRLCANEPDHTVVITSGELLRSGEVRGEELEALDITQQDYDTKVKIALSWLERCGRLQRDDNRTQVLNGRMLLPLEQAARRMDELDLPGRVRKQWQDVLEALSLCGRSEMVNTDWLSAEVGLSAEELLRLMGDMNKAGLISHDLNMTAYVHKGVADSSDSRLAAWQSRERTLLDWMEETCPDAGPEASRFINQRRANQEMLDRGEQGCRPQHVRQILRMLSREGLLRIKKRGEDSFALAFLKPWEDIRRHVEERRTVCRILLADLLGRVPSGQHGKDLLVSFMSRDMETALTNDLRAHSFGGCNDRVKQGLLALNDLEAITLQNGMAVFRPAMTIQVKPHGERFLKEEFRPLEEFFSEKVVQVHIMSRFAELGAEAIKRALLLVRDYFMDPAAQFVSKYFRNEKWLLKLPTSVESYRRIVTGLGNAVQQAAVEGSLDKNRLIVAGPGSGKTRVIVHRIAYLIRVRRVPPRSILALAFNRSAAGLIRTRLRDLIGAEAARVRVHTYHGLAMSLAGKSLEGRRAAVEDSFFDSVLEDAVQVLEAAAGDNHGVLDWRDRLLSGLRHILVDEYQDVNELEYRFLSMLAGRTEKGERKPQLMAVGDDDQNIYSYGGANLTYIRRFEREYTAEMDWLTTNYRSAPNLVHAANRLIAYNRDRMKTGREMAPVDGSHPGGQVRMFETPDEPSLLKAALELARKAIAAPGLDPSDVCILCRTHRELDALARMAPAAGLSARPTKATREPLTSTREFLLLKASLEECGHKSVKGAKLREIVHDIVADSGFRLGNPWLGRLDMLLDMYLAETMGNSRPIQDFIGFVYDAARELGREARPEPGRVGIMTIHSAKGLEFHTVIVAGQPTLGHGRSHVPAKVEEERRLFYVAATRAKERLAVLLRQDAAHPFAYELGGDVRCEPLHPSLSLEEARAYAAKHLELGLADVVISFPAFAQTHAQAQKVLSALEPGDSEGLELVQRGEDSWRVIWNSHAVACLSRKGVERLKREMGGGYVPVRVEHAASVVWEREEKAGESGEGSAEVLKRWLVGLFRVELMRIEQ